MRIERSRTSLRSFSSDDKFHEKILFENWAEDANLDDARIGYKKKTNVNHSNVLYPHQRFLQVISLSDFKWRSASYLDNHGVLCETHKFSREPTTSVCDLIITSNNGALFGEYKFLTNQFSSTTVPTTLSTSTESTSESSMFGLSAGNLFGASSRQAAFAAQNCFQNVECGNQHPIMFIFINIFDLSVVFI